MRHIRIFGSLAAVVVVLLAIVGSASATKITAGGSSFTGAISLSSVGHVTLDNPIAKIECQSSISIETVESHGEGVTAYGPIGTLVFGNCTNDWHVTVVTAGSIEVHGTGNGDGTVTSTGATIVATRFMVNCRYSTNHTDIGTITDGEHATLDITAAIPFHSGSFLCGSGATTWTGSYTVTTPTNLSIDQ